MSPRVPFVCLVWLLAARTWAARQSEEQTDKQIQTMGTQKNMSLPTVLNGGVHRLADIRREHRDVMGGVNSLKQAEDTTTKHYVTGMNALWFVMVLGSVLVYKYYFHKYKLLQIPESVASILIGVLIGVIMVLANSYRDDIIFHPELFFYVLLPPIIFKAGFGVEKTLFFENIGSVIAFAFIGTLISTLIIGFALFGFASYGIVPIDRSNALEALMFGTLISSTDPVSTVSIMSSLNTNPMLHALIFGESVLNDAVCITLYKVLEGYHPFLASGANMVEFQLHDFGKCMIIFVGITLVSIMIGAIFGLSCSWISNRFPMVKNHPEIEMGMTFFVAYASYCVGEIADMSGVMSLFFCAIILAHYHSHNLSESSKIAVESSVQTLGFFAETTVFVVLGITAVTSIVPKSDYKWSPVFLCVGLLLCLVSRAIQVLFVSNFLNLGLKERITGRMQFVMWLAGLRGAVSFALSLQVPAESSKYMATTTLAIVIITTALQGGLSGMFIQKLGLSSNEKDSMEIAARKRKNTVLCGACEENIMSRVFGGSGKTPVLDGSSHPIAVSGNPKLVYDDEDDEHAVSASLLGEDDHKADDLETVEAVPSNI